MSQRMERLEKLFVVEVGKILSHDVDLENGIILTVTRSRVSPTLEHATIMISVIPDSKAKKIFEQINKNIYHIQQKLNSRLKMRPIPKIRFEIDDAEKKAFEIEKLLNKI